MQIALNVVACNQRALKLSNQAICAAAALSSWWPLILTEGAALLLSSDGEPLWLAAAERQVRDSRCEGFS